MHKFTLPTLCLFMILFCISIKCRDSFIMLQIKHISKQYKTGELVQRALDDVSLNLRDNEFVAILGPSGSGKTTLLNIIGGLDRYDSGDLIINGVSTKEYNDRDWDTYRNHSIGFVFQSYNLIPHQNVLSNVELALTLGGLSAKERKEKAKQALVQVGLADHIYKKPNQMSGGQMQRVALARALVNDPDILLADEPTGALDTETSIQVMDLIQEVAKDRLVVMVTHNPELADQYASRIVRLKDGKIIDDSMPYTDQEIAAAPAVIPSPVPAVGIDSGAETSAASLGSDGGVKRAEKESAKAYEKTKATKTKTVKSKKKQSSMSFFTSLGLSFSNLRTKKGRTILTSFAGSIGIIGIALILSLSTGVNNYINKIQRDTMASYPITVSSTSLDLTSFMGNNGPNAATEEEAGEEEKGEKPAGKVLVNYGDIEASSAVSTSIKENNLTDFKKYLDDPNSEIHDYIGENGIVYTYDVDFKVYSYDQDNKLIDSDVDVTAEFSDDSNVLGNLMNARSLMLSNMSAMFGGSGNQNAQNFSEMMAGTKGTAVSPLITDNYDVVYGEWPDSYDEVVLVLNSNDSVFSGTLYQLGLITKAQYTAAVKKVELEEEPEEISLDYKDLCDHTFYLITASDLYEKTSSGTFSFQGNDSDKLEEAVRNAVPLHISGIVKASEDADLRNLETSICYTTMLTDYIVERGNNSDVITAQKASHDIDVLTGQNFMEEEPDEAYKAVKARSYLEGLSHDDKADAFSSIMVADYEGAMQAVMATQMGPISEQIGAALQDAIGSAISQAVQSMMTQMMGKMQTQMQQVMQQAMQKAMQQMMQQIMPVVMEQVATQIQTTILPQIATKIFPQVVEQAVLQNVQKAIEAMGEDLPEQLESLKNVTSLEDLSKALDDIPFDEIDYTQIDLSKLDIDVTEIDPSQINFSVLDFSSLDFSNIDLSKIDLSKIDVSGMDFSGLDLSNMDLSGLDVSGMDFSGVSSAMENISLSSEDADGAEAVQYWLDNSANQKSLAAVFDSLIGVSSYDGNMKKFGMVSYDAPSMISLYADSFEGKDGIAASIKNYNDKVIEENKITYTDYVALLTSSITTIINAISYVLIGFVGVSLFVSCIMIGIITNISVLERTKEIGVLRALGASKRNISNVFNAETFIIGCLSGIIGVGITWLLIIPINAIVHALMDSTVLSATLPPLSAVILILISIGITMIGGLIPAKKASRQDPVVALRTE